MLQLEKENVEAVGKFLCEQRIAMKLDVKELSKRTKIQSKYIKALEKGDLEVIKFSAYYIGYLKTYANALQISNQEIQERLGRANDNGIVKAPRSENLIANSDFNPNSIVIAISMLLTLILVAVLN